MSTLKSPRHTVKPLKPSNLYRPANLGGLDFETTSDLELLTGVIEQDRAVRALDLGLSINKRNYNVFVAGESGTGKSTMVRTLLKKIAPRRKTPGDWICVHNFKDPTCPRSIAMPSGSAAAFKVALAEVIVELREEVPKVFHSKEHQEKVQSILNKSLDYENQGFVELSKEAEKVGFTIKSTKTGIVTIPMIDEKIISNKDYAHLTDDERRHIEESRKKLDPHISQFLQRTRDIELKTHKRIQKLQRKLGERVGGRNFRRLRSSYKKTEEVVAFLNQVFEDFLENMAKFLPEDADPAETRAALRQPLKEYEVNVLVDNSETEGAPVIFENRPSWSNMFGKIERRMENGVYSTDFTLIRAGSLLRASGGYLIVNVLDLFGQPGVWEHLKSCLRSREVAIEDPGMLSPFLPTTGLKPDAIPVSPKIIFLGSHWAYYLMHQADEDFRKIFQVFADFDDEIGETRRTIREYAQFIATTCKNDGLLPVDRDGVAAIVEHGMRVAGQQRRLTLKFNDIANLVIEGDYHARRQRKTKLISRSHIAKALSERVHRCSLAADKMHREYVEGRQLLEVTGAVVGQINGLSVYSLGDAVFGRPTRITTNTFVGKGGVINIEREAKLSGSSHDKGVYIIAGYLGQAYAQDGPLALSVTICFEQSYGGVDGDSASSTELYSILSSLSGLPINQGIAVTGSVNQKGEIQPIGGVNEKIEGFFKACATRGLTGDQGVIIPHTNVANLMLAKDVRDAVEAGLFHVWPAKTITDGIELLMGVAAGSADERSDTTVHGRVRKQLDAYRTAGLPKKDSESSKG